MLFRANNNDTNIILVYDDLVVLGLEVSFFLPMATDACMLPDDDHMHSIVWEDLNTGHGLYNNHSLQ